MGLYDPQFEHDSCGVGFVAHIKGKKSHAIVKNALTMLEHMDHRGACGCEENTGDGAGILTGLPHDFLVKVAKRDAGIDLPGRGGTGRGLCFLPTDSEQRKVCEEAVVADHRRTGAGLLGWRDVPVDNSTIGMTARRIEPVMKMLFIGAGPSTKDAESLERQLYIIRKRATLCLPGDGHVAGELFLRLLAVDQGDDLQGAAHAGAGDGIFPRDLADPDYTSHLAMVHSRFSTNTFPSWDRRIRSGTWRTTARSTRCGAIATGCGRERDRCSRSVRR